MPEKKIGAGRPKKGKKDSKSREADAQVFHSRKYARVPLKMEVEYLSGDNLVQGKSQDISAGGMYITSPEPLPGGSDTRVRFVLDPEKEAVEVGGKVAWTNEGEERKLDTHPTGMGIEFVEDDEQKRKVILRFVKDLTDLLRIMAFTERRRITDT